MTAENFRDICSCQRHRSRRRRRELLRRKLGLGVLGGAVALAGLGFPLGAVDVVLPEAGMATMQVVEARAFGVAPPAFRPVPVPAMTEWALPLIPVPRAEHLSLHLEKIKEEFFRTEIPYGSIIYREALQQGLEPELVAAIVQTESDFRSKLVSHKNAHGLMQLVPSTAELMGVSDIFDPNQNIQGGTRYLSYLKKRFDEPQLVLAAYNAGETTVRRYGGVPPYRETQNYIVRVNERVQRFRSRIAERAVIATP